MGRGTWFVDELCRNSVRGELPLGKLFIGEYGEIKYTKTL